MTRIDEGFGLILIIGREYLEFWRLGLQVWSLNKLSLEVTNIAMFFNTCTLLRNAWWEEYWFWWCCMEQCGVVCEAKWFINIWIHPNLVCKFRSRYISGLHSALWNRGDFHSTWQLKIYLLQPSICTKGHPLYDYYNLSINLSIIERCGAQFRLQDLYIVQ